MLLKDMFAAKAALPVETQAAVAPVVPIAVLQKMLSMLGINPEQFIAIGTGIHQSVADVAARLERIEVQQRQILSLLQDGDNERHNQRYSDTPNGVDGTGNVGRELDGNGNGTE